MTDCNCKSRNGWSGDVCKAMHPTRNTYRCLKPDGHDGPHAACGRRKHPVKVWADASGDVKEQLQSAFDHATDVARCMEQAFLFHREDTGPECNFSHVDLHGMDAYSICPKRKPSAWVRIREKDNVEQLEDMR
jgi:hypothetical protein